MPAGKDNFHINANKYVKSGNYSIGLGNDTYVSAFQERLIIGPVCLDDAGEALFTKKAVVIPAQSFFEFTNAVRRAEKSFETENAEPWEMIIFKYSRVHHVVAKFERWEENDPTFRIQIKWNFKADRSFNRLVDMGMKDAIDTTNVTGDWLFLKRIASLNKEQHEILEDNLDRLLEYSFCEVDSKKLVLEFVDYVESSVQLRQFVLEKLKTYETLSYQSKMKILRQLLTDMFEQRNMEKDGHDYGMKNYLDALSNKIFLVFSLFNHRIEAAE